MFMASLANRMAMAQDAMATASDDRDMVMLRRVIAEFDLCQALHKLVAGGHIRVMELKP